ncbi:flagellar hook assembly protein FlgD [Chitinimonas sp. BJYL2]|uniref:flagellar hook assembly protein FlgD n=1 Tax=Chitinimonas sp. BJYL2 TaxID=2976696 RepID=UPI0022B4CB6C|nr:flagellar hook assembly protein FlgD [Chitinimonas sp. BJYL2]
MTTAVNSSADVFSNLNQARDSKSKTQEMQDRFLKLLITQLQSQDPMNPMDSAESTAQMAQMSMVSGIENLNSSITSMMTTFNASQGFQAASLIGKQVLVEGDTMSFDGEKPMNAQVLVPEGGARVKLTIYGAGNQKLDEIDMGQLTAGKQPIEWDGKDASGNPLPAGKYYLSATAQSSSGAETMLRTMTYMGVSSVSLDGGNVNVQLADGRTLPYSQISSIM